MRTRRRTACVLVLAGQLLVLILSAGLIARPAGRRAKSHTSQIVSFDPTAASEAPIRTPNTRSPWKRRLALTVGSMASILGLLSLATGVSLALLSSQQTSGSNTFTAGTVTLGTPGGSQTTCVLSVQPGGTTGAAILSSGLAAKTTYTSVLVDSVSSAISSGDTLILGEGNSTQTATASAGVAVTTSPTAIPVNAFTTGASPVAGGMIIDTTHPNTPCTFTIAPSVSSASSYVAVDIAIAGGSTGHAALWDGTTSGLQFILRDQSGNTYTIPVSANTACGSLNIEFSAPAGASACGQTLNDLLSTSSVTSSTLFTLSLNWSLDASVASTYQGGTANVMIAFHSVQSANNTLSCSATAVGEACSPSGSFGWS